MFLEKLMFVRLALSLIFTCAGVEVASNTGLLVINYTVYFNQMVQS